MSANSPWLHKVYDFVPAPGQFVNMLPEFEEGDTQETINAKVEENLCFDKSPGMISLGAFGGYVIVGFDHPVVNVPGEYDFKILGNAFVSDVNSGGGSCEPGIVMVSEDINENGLPDDPWYELAGSAYKDEATFHGLEMTYFRPDPDRAADADPDPDNAGISDRTYVKFTTNDPARAEGYVMRNSFHSQSYWPQWLKDSEELKFEGTCLPNNGVDMGEDGQSYWLLKFFDWGYADNRPNADDPGFKIDWAVDAEGNPVKLNGVHFIKIYTAVSQNCGWIGETSTEVSGGEDLHPDEVYTPTNGISSIEAEGNMVLLRSSRNALALRCAASADAEIYALSGSRVMALNLTAGDNTVDISALPAGAYILRAGAISLKFVK